MSDARISRTGNRLIFEGQLSMADLLVPLVVLHQAVNDAGHRDLILDFSQCKGTVAAPMMALIAQVMRLRLAQVDVELILPSDDLQARVFRNSNWAHLIDPRNFAPSRFRGYSQVPVTQFTNGSEQQKAVDKIVEAVMVAVPDLSRKELSALEWSVNEITDNVLNHAQSPIGGLVQVSSFAKAKKRIEYIVADAGLGIPKTLRSTHFELDSDVAALQKAIQEGVTRDVNVGQGNGLFGSYQICSSCKGTFLIESGHAKLSYFKESLVVRNVSIPYNGTIVAAQIDVSVPGLLEQALKFGGKPYHPTDYVEMKYEQDGGDSLLFKIAEESESFGSRVAGFPVRAKLLNLAKMCPNQKIILDFQGVPLLSSSYADEVVGKLFAEFGPLAFMQRFHIQHIDQTARQLVDRAIAQRMSSLSHVKNVI